jgi:hypothetical protein
MSHTFRGDKWLFLKGKTVRKGPPKQKLRADIVKMLDNLKESENGGFECYSEKHNWSWGLTPKNRSLADLSTSHQP